MNIFAGKRVEAEEIIDRPDVSYQDMVLTFAEQQIINEHLGGTHATFAHALPYMDQSASSPFQVLDMACGAADLSRAMVDHARKTGKAISVVAADSNEMVLQYARSLSDSYPEIEFIKANALDPPFDDDQFDLVIAATFLHHLSENDSIRALKACARICRGRVVIADLVRSRLAAFAFRIATKLLPVSKISAHDGAVSLLRAYTPSELAGLASRAGLKNWRVYTHSFYRMALVYDENRL